MKTKQEIEVKLEELLIEMFEVDAAAIKPDALLYEDLELDSIDAVDLVIRLQELTGKKIEPNSFKASRSVSDVVNAVYELVK
ncbi:MAG: acyl carrier protein [Kangiellaceae bacterium]|mgnify:CR=1 FL=1|jgi:acyl carrier protein|nr:acyl carrier protein [Kangiellaceae bacterium]|tara:strand:+ start:526 stop:771 length:246 start_codon:yes stop_codon:yes gene_type:complete